MVVLASLPSSLSLWLILFGLGFCYSELLHWLHRHPNTKPLPRDAMRDFIRWQVARMKGGAS